MGVFILEYGPRLFYGDATHLDAALVKDLTIERGSSGEMVLEWTAPPGGRSHFDGKNWKVEPMGKPVKRRYVWKGFHDHVA